jgi:K+-sensing histidine kinase KdpD
MNYERIFETAVKLLTPTTLDETYSVIVEEACQLIKGEFGSIFIAQEDQLQRVYSTVPEALQLIPRRRGNSYKAFKEGHPVVVSAHKLKKTHPELGGRPVKSLILIPLIFDKEAIGILSLHSNNTHFFTQKRKHVLQLFGSLASLKIRNMQLLEELQEALRLRDMFITMASHELKTPLTTVTGYTQLLHRQIILNKPVKPEWVTALRKETSRLKRLVKELLEVNQIKSGTLSYNFRLSSIKSTITQAIDDIGFAYPKHVITFKDKSGESDVFLHIDSEKIVQALTNILGNAAKFSEPTDPIRFTLKKNQATLTLTVTDQGEGISDRDIEHIFDGMYRGQDTKREGMGMGLYVANSVIKAHRGEIKVSSQKNIGTTVKIILPLTRVI